VLSDFINKLSKESWDTLFNNEDVNDMFNYFLNDYLRIFNSSFPLQTVMIRKNSTNNEWITKGIKISCNNKRKLYLACRHHNNEEIKGYYQLYSNILANVIREAKKINYRKKILRSNNKYKTTWDIIKEISGHQHHTINMQDIKVANEHIIDQQEIAEVFNDYFTFKKDKVHKYKAQNRLHDVTSRNCYTNNNDIHPSSSFVFRTFSTKEISSIVKSIKTKSSHGYDGISTEILKVSSNYIISPLTYICNKAILSDVFLDRLKFSIVKPVYKKGDRMNLANYRPISLLTSFSKVLEKALYNRLTEYLYNNNLLVENQSGIRKGLATDDAIFKLINEILNTLNNKMKTGSVFCDLEKAFDTVNHELLLDKLQYYGIKGKAKTLLESYL
jgi:hypothetical protein